MNKLLPFGIVVISLLMVDCSNPATAGGSSDHGNAYAGVALTSNGKPAANALIRILPDNYNHLTDSSHYYRQTMTDSSGRFVLDSIPDGIYCVSGTDTYSGEGFLKKKLRLENNDSIYDQISLNANGSIYIHKPDSLGLSSGMVLILPGLALYAKIESTSVRLRNIPPGSVEISGYDPINKKFVPLDSIFAEIDILPNKSLFLPSRSPRPFYVANDFTFHRALIGQVDTMYLFSAVEPTKPFDQRYSYRFSWGDGMISEWSDIASAEYSWSKPGKYLIQTQTSRAGMYDAWSDYLTVIIQ